MSNNVTVANVPEQLPRTFLYRTDIVNTVNFVHYHYQYYIMNSFGDQIKNTSTEFVLRLYEITKRSASMSILKLEESIGLAPTTHGQDLLGSLGTQGAGLAKLVPKGPTQTQTFEKSPSHTGSMADIKQEASKNTPQAQNAANKKKKQEKKTNTNHQNERTTESIQNERDRRRRIHLENLRRHSSAAANTINRTTAGCQAHGQWMHTPYSRSAAMMRSPWHHHHMRFHPNGQDNWQQHMNPSGEQQHMRFYPNGQDNGMFFYNGQGTQDLRGPRGRFC